MRYEILRGEEEDGSFFYEIWDTSNDRRMFTIREDEAATRGDALKDARRVVNALNLTAE